MSRRLYETSADREREFIVKGIAEDFFQLSAEKVPIKYHVDYALLDHKGNIRHWLEIRCREIESDKYKELILSLDKYKYSMELLRWTSIPVLFMVQWRDRTGFTVLDGETAKVRFSMGGRTGRLKSKRDAADFEPCVYVDIERSFQWVPEEFLNAG